MKLAMKVERAMMLYVGCRNWDAPKAILVPTSGEYGRRLNEIAKEEFEKYEAVNKHEEIYLVDYYLIQEDTI